MAGIYIRNKHQINQSSGAPESERGVEQVYRESKQPARITPPKESLKKIEKNIVKRQTQLFETSSNNPSDPSEYGRPRQNESPSPYMYKPSSQAVENIYQNKPSCQALENSGGTGNASHNSALSYHHATNQQDQDSENRNTVSSSPYAYRPSAQVPSANTEYSGAKNTSTSPYLYKPSVQNNRPKLDVSVSKAIGEQAKAMIEKRKQENSVDGVRNSGHPPDRPKVPPSPGITREKPKYPYSPSVETEIDHKKIEPKQKYGQPPSKSSNLQVNISHNSSNVKTSPKTPSPPARPPPPKFPGPSEDKRVSTLMANKLALFQSGDNKTEDGKQSPGASTPQAALKPPVTNSTSKPHVKLKSSISFEKIQEEITANMDAHKTNQTVIIRPKIPDPTYQSKRNSQPDEEKDNNNVSLTTKHKTDNYPDYAQIDKEKKVKDRRTKFENATKAQCEGGVKPKVINPKTIDMSNSSSDKLECSGSASQFNNPVTSKVNSSNPVAPPPKPPRTFQYDEDLKRKRDKREKKMKSREMPVSPLVTADHKYDDLSETSSGVNFKPGGNRSPRKFDFTNSEGHLYEDIAPRHDNVYSPQHSTVSKSKSHDTILRKKTYTYDKLDDENMNPCNNILRKKVNTYDKLDEDSVPVYNYNLNKPDPPPRPQTSLLSKQPLANKSRWDQGFVMIKSPNPELKKKPIIARKAVTNPGYEWTHECIPIKTYFTKDGGMKRYKSEESLYMGSNSSDKEGSEFREEPVYYDPVDVAKTGTPYVNRHGVSIDAEGYAVPDISNSTLGKNRTNRRFVKNQAALKRTGTMAYDGTGKRQNKRFSKPSLQSHASIKEKLNEAYSVLRRGQCVEGLSEANTEQDGEDSDSDLDQDELRKKLDYINITKLRIKDPRYRSIYEKAMIKSPQTDVRLMFDYALIVGLENVPDTKIYKPKVLYSFPHQESTELPIIASFCFPDANIWRPVSQYRSETFSFVLTASDGSRQYGYCKRFLPPDPNENANNNRLPEVYCIISSLQGWSLYNGLLKQLQKKRKISLHLAQELLNAAYGRPLPPPGQDVWIRSFGENDTHDTVIINRPADDRLDKISETLLDRLSVDKLLKVFSALVLERKLLFVAQHLGTLTDCIHALISLLYPFSWQHTFIPVIPGDLIDVIEAPTPYVVGVLAMHYAQVQERDLTEVMIIDLDNNCIIQCQDDEDKIIPKKLQKALKSALKGEGVAMDTKNELVSEAFLRMFVETVGHYTNYVNTQQDGRKEFQRELFVRAVTSKSIKMFLEWFSETHMFEVFVTDRMENPNIPDGLFEVRLEEYQEEMSRYHPTVKQNIREAGKKMLNFLFESGGKIKKVFV